MRGAVSRSPAKGALACAAVLGCAGISASPDGRAGGSAGAPPAPARSRCERALDPAAQRALQPLPRLLGGFCLDPYAAVRVYGADAPASLERACEQVLGPGCGNARSHDLARVTALRYVEGGAGQATLDVVASRFADASGAYASFTERLVGDRDPAELHAEPLSVPGVAVRDGARVSSWVGRFVLDIYYGDESVPSAALAAAAAARLPEVALALSRALPEKSELPLAVQKLPTEHRLPLGVRLLSGDALGVAGVGAGAIGHYRDGQKRWRVLSIVTRDDESARDVLGTLASSPTAYPIRNAPFSSVFFGERRLPGEPNVGWVVGLKHEVVYGVGDDASALPEYFPAEREAAVKLSFLDKLHELTRIRAQ
jgi:hypothetical protein